MSTKEPNGSKSDEHECPTCGKTYGSSQWVSRHHKSEHGEPRPFGTTECGNCGETLEREPYVLEQYDVHYCSRQCKADDQNGYEVVQCDYCGDDVRKRTDQIEKYDHHFCDIQCSSGWQKETREVPTGPDHGCYKERVEIGCDREGCKKTREVLPSQIEQFRFCSSDCAYEHLSGEGSPHWRGGHEYDYGTSWWKQRQRALDRDGYRCQVCGSESAEGERELDVHHIMPFRLFGTERHNEANRLDNLIVLCRSCHSQWEGIPLRPQ